MSERLPFFSIVVPTCGRPVQLAACLQSLTCQSYPRDRFEVVIIDDGGETPPEAVIARFGSQFDLRWHTQARAGPAAARNAGVRCARGEFIAFTDDDCWPGSGWLESLAVRFHVAADCAIGGRTLNALRGNPYSFATQLLVDYLYLYFNADPNQACFLASNNLALKRDRFVSVGGFDATFPLAAGEDREFCDRWLRHGYRMVYAPEAVVYHAHALTLRTFWRQHFGYGRGARRFHSMCARRNQDHIKLEPLSFYARLLSYPLSQARLRRAPLFAALLVLSQAANMAGFFWEKASRTYEKRQNVSTRNG